MLDEKILKRIGSKHMTVKVTNKFCGRIDTHKDISREDYLWMACNPNLQIEIVEWQSKEDKKSF